MMYCSDESGEGEHDDGGFGVCRRVYDETVVADVGRFSEPWRFAAEHAVNARRAALQEELNAVALSRGG